MMRMIDVQHLTKKYGDVTAVDDLTFHVDQGEVFGLLGPNGAGKTTTIRMLCCLIAKAGGDAKIGGYEIGNETNGLKIRKMIGLVPENVGLFDELSAYENLDYYGKLYECPQPERKENIEYFLKLLGLWDKRDQPVGDFSKGMKQKVAIARALIHQPKLLFLDEPTANLDPESARVVREFLLQLKREGKTIFLNTHNLDEAQRICDRIGILKTKLLAINTPEQLEKSIWGSKTVIQLEKIDAAILVVVKALLPSHLSRQMVVEGNQIIVDVTDPLKENPDYVQAIVSAGGRVQSVTQLNPGLEETYLKVIGETK
jgi:ABC-2 type transport system ATP-binding protein